MSNYSRLTWIAVFGSGVVVGIFTLTACTGSKDHSANQAIAEQSSGPPAATLPPEVKPGAVLVVYANGAKLAGKHTVKEVKGNWVLFEIEQTGDKWPQWVNFNAIPFFELG